MPECRRADGRAVGPGAPSRYIPPDELAPADIHSLKLDVPWGNSTCDLLASSFVAAVRRPTGRRLVFARQ
jgi:hypothetical protein